MDSDMDTMEIQLIFSKAFIVEQILIIIDALILSAKIFTHNFWISEIATVHFDSLE